MDLLTKMTKLIGAAPVGVRAVPPAPDDRARRFTLKNFGSGRIGAVRLRPAGAADWGRDLLAGRMLTAGEAADFTPCGDRAGRRFDLWIGYEGGAILILRGLDLFSGREVCVTEDGGRAI
jgi:hypothetical protein